MRNYFIAMITLMIVGLAASAQANEADKPPDPLMNPAVAGDADKEIIEMVEMVEMMEMLKLMEILKEMELVKDYDLFAEEETDENKN